MSQIDKFYFEGKEYKKGDEISRNIKYLEDVNGRMYDKHIEGTIHQITDNLIVIQKKHYKECFQLCEIFYVKNDKKVSQAPFNVDNYCQNTINECVDDLLKDGKGHVFTSDQLNSVYNTIENTDILCDYYKNNSIETNYIDGIYMLQLKGI